MSFQVVRLLKNPGKTPVEAKLHTAVSLEQLSQAESKWKDLRYEVVLNLIREGRTREQMPEHWHWDWVAKVRNIALSGIHVFGIECEGDWQGLVMITHEGYSTRSTVDQGLPLAYVKYIESAPWNVKNMTATPRFSGVGVRLMEAVVRQSMREGFSGRVGLHSLPLAKSFYEAIGFSFLAVDADVEDLPYYEMSAAASLRFLEGGL
jgi:hypothetical protein